MFFHPEICRKNRFFRTSTSLSPTPVLKKTRPISKLNLYSRDVAIACSHTKNRGLPFFYFILSTQSYFYPRQCLSAQCFFTLDVRQILRYLNGNSILWYSKEFIFAGKAFRSEIFQCLPQLLLIFEIN